MINFYYFAASFKVALFDRNAWHGLTEITKFDDRVSQSLNCFEYSLDETRLYENARKIETITLNCQFSDWVLTNAHLIGLNTQKETNIGNIEEGTTLENHVWFSIESLFHHNIYLNPQFKSKDGTKELTDILAFHELGIFLIETKGLSIFSSNDDRSMDKKILRLKKHIRKAVRQLRGAIKTIEQEIEIMTTSGKQITFKRDIVPHCIVLVSELFQFGDWSDIEQEVIKTIKKDRFFLNIMDFREFMKIVKNSQQNKLYLDYYLMQRWEAFVKTQSIFLRSEFKRR